MIIDLEGGQAAFNPKTGQLSYKGSLFKVGSNYRIQDSVWNVTAIHPSKYIDGVKNVTLRRVN